MYVHSNLNSRPMNYVCMLILGICGIRPIMNKIAGLVGEYAKEENYCMLIMYFFLEVELPNEPSCPFVFWSVGWSDPISWIGLWLY